jgi:HEAT repeat protein
MAALEKVIRERYLNRLDDDWLDDDPRLDFGSAALPYFVEAFEKETDPQDRARLIRIIWQFRDAAALPTLGTALGDPSEVVWKDALDGIVALGGKQAHEILQDAYTKLENQTSNREKLEWISEALAQIIKQ